MGGKLCTVSKFGSHRSNPCTDNECTKPPSSEFVGLTSCFNVKKLQKKKKKKKKDREEVGCEPEPSEKKVKLTRHHLTLEEWILSSPGTDRAQSTVARGELFVFTQVYKSTSPSSSLHSNIVVEEEGFPSRRVVMEDGEGYGEDSSSICRSESKRSRKKVSFRLPEETDSIVFYTPSPVETDLNAEITKMMTSRIMTNNSL